MNLVKGKKGLIMGVAKSITVSCIPISESGTSKEPRLVSQLPKRATIRSEEYVSP